MVSSVWVCALACRTLGDLCQLWLVAHSSSSRRARPAHRPRRQQQRVNGQLRQ
jgi:hypothetical protein